MNALTPQSFDYGQLDGDTCQFVQDAAAEIRRVGKQTVETICKIGQHLTEVRERLPHGQWLPWLKAEFAWSETTARRFIDSHALIKSANLEDLPRLLELPPSSLAEIAAPATPEPARQEVLEQVAAGNKPTTTQVKKIVAQHKPAPSPKPASSPKPKLVEGVDYQLAENRHGYKYRRPIEKPTVALEDAWIAMTLLEQRAFLEWAGVATFHGAGAVDWGPAIDGLMHAVPETTTADEPEAEPAPTEQPTDTKEPRISKRTGKPVRAYNKRD